MIAISAHGEPIAAYAKPLKSVNWFLVVALLLAAFPVAGGIEGGSPLRQLLWTATFGVAVLIAIFRPKKTWALITATNPAFWLLLFYVGLSVLWSPDEWISFKRYSQLLFIAAIAIAGLTSRTGVDGSLSSAGLVAFTGIAIGAIVYTLLFPSESFDDINNGWRGFTGTKNNFGQMMLLCTTVWAFGARLPQSARWIGYVAATVSLVMLGFTRSGGAIVALVIAGSLVLISRSVRRAAGSPWTIALLGGLNVLLFGLLIAYVIMAPIDWEGGFEAFLGLFGRDIGMTGRSYLWQLMMDEFAKHMWFGQGYGSFWTGLSGEAGHIAELVGWGYPGQAHNGYIDILNETGITGAALLALLVVTHVYNLFRLRRRSPEAAAIHFVMLIAILLSNITESSLLRTTSLLWLCFVISVCEVSYLVSRHGLRHPEPRT